MVKVKVLVGSLTCGLTSSEEKTYQAGEIADLPREAVKVLRVAPLRPADVELVQESHPATSVEPPEVEAKRTRK